MATINQVKVGTTTYDIRDTSKLEKLTYEWNKSYNAGGTAGYLLIGSFPMYDTNITIDIDATTNTTYHGTIVIATQNVSTTSMGSAHTITVYGDPTGTISNAIRVVWTSGSRNYNVYFVPSPWSKNLIHIRGIGNYLEDINESKICTQFTTGTAPATTSGLTVVNALTSAFNLTKDKVTTALGYTPPTSDTDTHYTTRIYAGASGTATNAAVTSPYIKVTDNNTYRNQIRLLGSGATTVSSDANGNITISSTDNNTTYSAATQSAAGLMSAADKKKLDGVATGANNYTYTLPAATSSALGGVKVGSNITVSSGTISLTKANVTAALGYTPPTSDTNTTYSAGTGISLSGTTFSNSGVRSVATGSSNGTISVNTNGTAANVAVKGLGSAAYTASTAYATAAQGTLATNAMPKSGGTFTGAVNMGSNTFTTRKVNFNGGNSWISDHDGSGHILFAFNQNNASYKGQIILTTTGVLRPFTQSGEFTSGSSCNYQLGLLSAPWNLLITKGITMLASPGLATAYTGSGNAVWVNNGSSPASYTLKSSKALSSSRTIKHDIKPLQNKDLLAEHLYNINVHQAKYNADIISKDDCRYLKDMPMFIIEEMDEIYPIAVTKPEEDPKTWSWEPAYMIPPMLKLIQDQKKQLNELEKRIQKLEEAK